MAPIYQRPWLTLYFEGNFLSENFLGITIVFTTIVYTWMNQKTNMACNFDCIFETEGSLKVHCKCGNMSETVQDSRVAVDH